MQLLSEREAAGQELAALQARLVSAEVLHITVFRFLFVYLFFTHKCGKSCIPLKAILYQKQLLKSVSTLLQIPNHITLAQEQTLLNPSSDDVNQVVSVFWLKGVSISRVVSSVFVDVLTFGNLKYLYAQAFLAAAFVLSVVLLEFLCMSI